MTHINRILGTLLLAALIVNNHFSIIITEADPNIRVVNVLCNQDTFTDNAFGQCISNVLDKLLSNTPYAAGYSDFIEEANQGATVYGYANRSSQLSATECYDCLDFATYNLSDVCSISVGAEIDLVDCRVRYEAYDFMGSEENG